MKIKRIISVFMVFVIVIISSGCSLNFFSTETLLKPPALSGKSGEVQEAFNKLMNGKTFLLKTPTKGEYRSSFVLYNFDEDEEEEALVFYTDPSTDTSVRIVILDFIKNTWVLVADIKGSGSGIYDVSFPDLNGDTIPEVVVAWSLFDNKLTKMVTVYQTTRQKDNKLKIEALANEYFNAKGYFDLNSNGVDDLVLVYLDDAGEVQNSYFRAFSVNENGGIVKFSEVLLDSSITSVSSINADTITHNEETYTRVFIDCLKSDTSIFTEVLSWDLDSLRATRILAEPAKNTLRNAKLLSQDIDNDGNLEVPVNKKFFTGEKDPAVVISGVVYNFTMIEWLNMSGDKKSTEKTIYNPIHSYLFVFPWGNNTTVNFDKIENQTNFCIWNTHTKEIEDILFSIKFIEKSNTLISEVEEFDETSVLTETENGIFIYEITQFGEDFGITDEFVQTSFKIV